MTPEMALWVLGVLVAVLGFFGSWQFTKIIKLGERITAHDIEIIGLRAQLLKAESDLRQQHDKTEGAVATAITKLEASLTNIGHNIEQKVNTLHGRLDTFLMESHHRQQGGSNNGHQS